MFAFNVGSPLQILVREDLQIFQEWLCQGLMPLREALYETVAAVFSRIPAQVGEKLVFACRVEIRSLKIVAVWMCRVAASIQKSLFHAFEQIASISRISKVLLVMGRERPRSGRWVRPHCGVVLR